MQNRNTTDNKIKQIEGKSHANCKSYPKLHFGANASA